MTLENLTWALIGFATAGAAFILFYDWSLSVIAAKNLKNARRAWNEGYDMGSRHLSAKWMATNEATGPLPEVGATLIAEDKEARPGAIVKDLT